MVLSSGSTATVRSFLTTSGATYDAAANNTWVEITQAEWDALTAWQESSAGGRWPSGGGHADFTGNKTYANSNAVTPSGVNRWYFAIRFNYNSNTSGSYNFIIRQGGSFTNMQPYGNTITKSGLFENTVYAVIKEASAHNGFGYHSVYYPSNVRRYDKQVGSSSSRWRTGNVSNPDIVSNAQQRIQYLYTSFDPY